MENRKIQLTREQAYYISDYIEEELDRLVEDPHTSPMENREKFDPNDLPEKGWLEKAINNGWVQNAIDAYNGGAR